MGWEPVLIHHGVGNLPLTHRSLMSRIPDSLTNQPRKVITEYTTCEEAIYYRRMS
jgi:hypothetical protein